MRRFATTIFAVLLLSLPASAFANTAVTVNDSNYDPAAVKIAVGGEVDWTWNTTALLVQRSVTSNSGDPESFDSGPQGNGAMYSHTFTTPGVYGYHDTAGGGQTGTVTVYGSPSLALTPASSTINRGGSVAFTATADSNPSGATLTYAWDLDGNGTYETPAGATETVAYPTAGAFSVGVQVTDAFGNRSTATATVQVNVPDSDGDGFNDDADQCPNDAGVAPNGCPIVIPPIPGPIATSAVAAPDLSVAGALKSGITTVLSCSDTCSAVFTVTRSGRTVSVPLTTKLTGPGSTLVTIKFSRLGKRLLRKVRNPRLSMRVAVTDALGRVQTQTRTVRLKVVRTYGKLPAIGISDNQPSTFSDPNFQVLRMRYARVVTPWDGIFTEPDRLDQWLQAARAHHIRPLVSFEHERGMVCPGRHCKGPSRSQYTKAWKAFHKKYPWVRDISPWNEVNSATQPTGKHPTSAATYYNVVRARCRHCTIVAADLLDSSNIRRYAASFLKHAKGKPRLWGLHNYTDTNRFRSRGTTALLQSVKGTVWLTETGGVVRFVTQTGKVALPKSESRARRAMDYMFRLAEKNAKRIKRIYVYQWKVNNVFDRFDAGLVRPDGTPRPSYDVLTLNASIAARR